MPDLGNSSNLPTENPFPSAAADPRLPLLNLSTVQFRMDSLHNFLSESVNKNHFIGKTQMDMVSGEISSAIHQIIVNGAALLSCAQTPLEPLAAAAKSAEKISDPTDLNIPANYVAKQGKHAAEFIPKLKEKNDSDVDCDLVELDAVELLEDHVHFCEICGKGFKRDANLRMHMRAHGNQFKTLEALSKPEKLNESPTAAAKKKRFSCPFEGCNRNKKHKKFRALKSVICVKNHFKRSHCPKMYSCNRCNRKSFSVVADLRSHLKHCGESKWKCRCGTSFSRKDKLFGHMALFEGHMPAIAAGEEENKGKIGIEVMEEDEVHLGGSCGDNGVFEGLLEGFDSIEGYSMQDVFASPDNFWGSGNQEF